MEQREVSIRHFIRESLCFYMPEEIVGESMNSVVVIAEPALYNDDKTEMVWRVWAEVNNHPIRYGVGEVLTPYYDNVTDGKEAAMLAILKDGEIAQNVHAAIAQAMFMMREKEAVDIFDGAIECSAPIEFRPRKVGRVGRKKKNEPLPS